MRLFRMMAAGSLLGVAAPAIAADPAELGATARASWVRGANAGLTPVMVGEQTDCAIYWEQWSEAIGNHMISDALLAGVPVETQMQSAYDRTRRWGDRIAMVYLNRPDGERAFDEALNRETPRISGDIAGAVAGDTAKMQFVMEMLAICRNP